ncbi:hypothetical protein JAAARDRAFT_319740 [Jaapia argillacea MUCL 33604]|uniref:F-box domain-containing protein n=1 Tax=Jaapia argillacea MUCL 33604 TaxID=933084 RepID=A0A067PMP0_9AGAM|nr:hypothetical protein JAAARDRAFT_319740 [Jaapia argillacea MUCL 33604]
MSSFCHRRAAVVPPIEKVPIELLGAIFVAGHRSQCLAFEGGWNFSFRSTISLVSRGFREVAIQTPGLWGDILLSVGHYDDDDHTERPPMEYLEMCLRRSSNIQLQIFAARLCDKCHNGDNSCPRLDRCMELIAPHLTRIQAIALVVNTMEVPDNLFDHLRDVHVPAMETLYLHDEYDCLILDFPIFQGGAPRLSSLSIPAGLDVRLEAGPFLPLAAVTDLYLDGTFQTMTSDQLVTLTEATPQLRELSLSHPSVIVINRPEHQVPCIRLPNLTSLTLFGDASNFISHLHSPTVQHLCLSGYSIPRSVKIIASQRKFPALESLSMDQYYEQEPTIYTPELARSTPLLKDLHLPTDSTAANAFLAFLREPLPEDPTVPGCCSLPWPLLQSLRLSSVRPEPLRELLIARIQHGIPIQSLTVCDRSNQLPSGADGMEMVRWIEAQHAERSLVADRLAGWMRQHGMRDAGTGAGTETG